MAEWIAAAVLVAVVVTAAATDLARGQVYNWLTYPAVLAGLAIWTVAGAVDGGWSGAVGGLGGSLAGLLIAFVPMLIAFQLGGIGGGDAKLAAAIGAIGCTRLALYALFYGFLVSGVIALIVMVSRRVVRQTMGRIGRFLWLLSAGARPAAPTAPGSPKIATALGWAIGTIWAVAERMLWDGRGVLDWLIGR